MDSQVEFTDLRGRKFSYAVLRFEDNWGDLPGNYVFARRTAQGWVPLFIGETANFRKRMAGHHEAWDWCRSRGAAWVLAHVNRDEAARRDEERALMVAYDPPGNFPVEPRVVALPELSRAA